MHSMAANFTGVMEFEIDNEEAKSLAESVADVASHYNVTADPKTMAWVGLASTLGMVYGPRFAAIRIRRKIEKEGRPNKAKVTPLRSDIDEALRNYVPTAAQPGG